MIVRPSAVLRNVGLILALVGFAAILPTGGGQPALAGPKSVEVGQPAPVKENSPAASKLLTCGSFVDDVVKIQKDARETLSTCSLAVPEGGHIFVSANGSAGFDDAYARVLFRIKIDGSQKYETDRYMAVFDDAGDGSDASVALSGLFPVAAGSHIVSFLGLHNSGAGTLRVYDPSLTVLFIPGSGTDLLTCSDMDSTEFSTSSIDFVVMRSCTLTLPGDGWAFISADGSALGTSTPSEAIEAAFTIGIDNTTGTDDATRWVDTYGVGLNGKDAVDRTIALTMLKPVSAGRHTFNFVARRTIGSSDIRVASPSLSVIYMPAPGLHVASCGVLDRTPWTTTSGDFSVVRQCSLNLPEDSVAFIAADANLGLSVDPFEAHLRLGIDSTEGDGDTDRYVNVYPNSTDGTDDSAAVTVLKPVTAGRHDFYLLGRSMLGQGTTLLRYATLTVLVPVTPLPLPLAAPILSAPANGATQCNGRPTFTWNGVDRATSHRIQVDDDSAFGSPEINERVMGASYSVAPAQEIPDGEHYWRVRGLSPLQSGPWSATWRFSVGPPAAPKLRSPADGTTTNDTTPKFRWSSIQGGTEYRLRVGRDPSFSSVALDVNVAGKSHTPAVALAGGTYYWMVQANNPCAWGDWSATRRLTIRQTDHQIYLPLVLR